MSDKFSFYQTEGLWGIIENASDEKQTSIKSYFGSDLIIKRLNEQAEQIDQLKQQLAEKDKEIEKLKQELEETNAGYDFIYEQSGETIKELQQNQKQLAIQELSEVERLLYESHYKEIDNRYYAEYEDIKNLIDSRIQALEELKGEKDVED